MNLHAVHHSPMGVGGLLLVLQLYHTGMTFGSSVVSYRNISVVDYSRRDRVVVFIRSSLMRIIWTRPTRETPYLEFVLRFIMRIWVLSARHRR